MEGTSRSGMWSKKGCQPGLKEKCTRQRLDWCQCVDIYIAEAWSVRRKKELLLEKTEMRIQLQDKVWHGYWDVNLKLHLSTTQMMVAKRFKKNGRKVEGRDQEKLGAPGAEG